MVDVYILDVGHGLAAAIYDAEGWVVIDGGMGQILVRFLRSRGATTIDSLIASHQDADHLGGAVELLLDKSVTVRSLHVNPDLLKKTRISANFRTAAADAQDRGTEVFAQLSTSSSPALARSAYRLEVLYPSGATALAGVGGSSGGTTLTSNGMSGVVRLTIGGKGAVLFAGDMERSALEEIVRRSFDLSAQFLVFPHHGGRPEADNPETFSRDLVSRCNPQGVVFSIGRGMHDTPRPEVIAGVRQAAPKAWIACTQLSKHCEAVDRTKNPEHLWTDQARGFGSFACCAGTICIRFFDTGDVVEPDQVKHKQFVRAMSTPLCLRTVQRT